MQIAYKEGSTTVLPVMVQELCDRSFMKLEHANVFTVGPATNVPTLSVYSLTEYGKKTVEQVFGIGL